MIIDAHNHILAAGLYPGYERFIKEMTRGFFQSRGKLPADREPADQDWKGLEYLWNPIDPDVLLRDHATIGVDKCTILAVAPSEYTRYEARGTVDIAGVTGVEGPPSIAKGNDYIAALVGKYPDKFIGMAAVNPRFRGVRPAVAELERAVTRLGLTGLKLYPMYDHWAVNDRDLAFPIFAKAAELDIPVMIHLSTTPVSDTVLLYGWPVLLDDVARAFPSLRMLVCHAGHPWVDECLVLASRHPNVYLDVSFFNSTLTRRQTYEFLQRARQLGCPWSRICWATDYPGFEFPETLLPKFALVNDAAEDLDSTAIPEADLARMLGGNYARFIGMDWSLEQTRRQMGELEAHWRRAWGEETARAAGSTPGQPAGPPDRPRPKRGGGGCCPCCVW
jgi:predicted TIM-barrel fold metal-dependent hydrolase